MKVSVRISGNGRTGVSRKVYDENPTYEAVCAQVKDAMAQTLEDFGKKPKKAKK